MLNYFVDLLDELQFPNLKQEKKNQKTPVLILPLKPVLQVIGIFMSEWSEIYLLKVKSCAFPEANGQREL